MSDSWAEALRPPRPLYTRWDAGRGRFRVYWDALGTRLGRGTRSALYDAMAAATPEQFGGSIAGLGRGRDLLHPHEVAGLPRGNLTPLLCAAVGLSSSRCPHFDARTRTRVSKCWRESGGRIHFRTDPSLNSQPADSQSVDGYKRPGHGGWPAPWQRRGNRKMRQL